MSKFLTITFPKSGPPKISAEGFQGSECLRATKVYEDALGGKVESRVEKPEMHAVTGSTVEVQQQ